MVEFDEKVSRQVINQLEYYRMCPLEEIPVDVLRLLYREKEIENERYRKMLEVKSSDISLWIKRSKK